MFSLRRKVTTFLVMLMLSLPVLAGCGDSTATSTSSQGVATTAAGTVGPAATTAPAANSTGQKVTLTFWNGFTGSDRPGVEAVTKKFSDANPNITVNMDITPWDSLMQKLLSTMSTGQGPDVVAIHFQYLPQYAKSGYIMDLSSSMKAEPKGACQR